jgi:transposase InsO family protein
MVVIAFVPPNVTVCKADFTLQVELVNNYGIKKKNSTPFNPQSNGIIERVHLTLNDSLRTSEIDGREMDEKDPWGPFLSSAAYAIRSTSWQTNPVKVTTTTDKNIMSFNPCHQFYSSEPWMHIVLSIHCWFVIISNCQHLPPCSACDSNTHTL